MMQLNHEIFEDKAEILKGVIRDDTKWSNDSYLGDFMKGRLEIEEEWLDECQKMAKGTPEVSLSALESRRAMIKTYIAEKRNKFDTIDGQKMRGGVVVLEHWLEETERLIDLLQR